MSKRKANKIPKEPLPDNILIEAKNVSVDFIIGDLKNIGMKEYVMKKLRGKYKVKHVQAVNNVSFTLEKGDMLGIIGGNGAGKSTLLKAVTHILVPTTGYVRTNGKISALLELVSGFDGNLTLKENALLRGAILGYSREYINEKYPEIIEFSGLKNFEEHAFRQLSSGMKSRFAFALSTLVEPEILILDEVLAVGDGAFRTKSENKMREIIEKGKATILVSHSINSIKTLCNKVLWLDKGQQVAFGDAKLLCDLYTEYLKTGVLPEFEDRYAFQEMTPAAKNDSPNNNK